MKPLLLLLILSCLVLTIHAQEVDYHNVLNEYVWKQPDLLYSYKPMYHYSTQYATVHVLNVTSGQWLPTKELGLSSTWFHYLEIAIPHTLDRRMDSLFAHGQRSC